MNKVSGSDGIPAELFQILKDGAVKVLHLVCQQIWKTQQCYTGMEKISFHSNPEKCSDYQTLTLISHASKVMLKILQARLQYMNRELPDVEAEFRKGRETRGQIADICWVIGKAIEFQKNISSASLTILKTLCGCGSQQIVGKFLEMRIPDHPTCHLRKLYAGQEATIRTGHGTTDWFQIGKGVHQGCILSPYLFNLNAENIMRNARMDDTQVGIKISRRNTNDLRYAGDRTLMAESKE